MGTRLKKIMPILKQAAIAGSKLTKASIRQGKRVVQGSAIAGRKLSETSESTAYTVGRIIGTPERLREAYRKGRGKKRKTQTYMETLYQ